jgi:hypothetical protein
MRCSTLLLALVAAVGCSSTPPSPPTAASTDSPIPPTATVEDAVINQVVGAYGGEGAVQRLASSRMTGDVTPHARDVGGAGRLERHLDAPDRIRVEIVYPAKTEVRILDGQRAWRGDGSVVEPVAGPPLHAMRYQLLRSQPAWALATHRDRVTLRADVERGGRTHRALRLQWSSELVLDYLVETDTGRVIRVDGTISLGQAAITFATEYSEFEMVDGALVPRVEETYASGRHTATTRIETVELGVSEPWPFSGPY